MHDVASCCYTEKPSNWIPASSEQGYAYCSVEEWQGQWSNEEVCKAAQEWCSPWARITQTNHISVRVMQLNMSLKASLFCKTSPDLNEEHRQKAVEEMWWACQGIVYSCMGQLHCKCGMDIGEQKIASCKQRYTARSNQKKTDRKKCKVCKHNC